MRRWLSSSSAVSTCCSVTSSATSSRSRARSMIAAALSERVLIAEDLEHHLGCGRELPLLPLAVLFVAPPLPIGASPGDAHVVWTAAQGAAPQDAAAEGVFLRDRLRSRVCASASGVLRQRPIRQGEGVLRRDHHLAVASCAAPSRARRDSIVISGVLPTCERRFCWMDFSVISWKCSGRSGGLEDPECSLVESHSSFREINELLDTKLRGC